MPIFLTLNLAAGILLVSKKKNTFWLLIAFFAISMFFLISGLINTGFNDRFGYLKLALYFIFYSIVTVEIIKQVWKAKIISKNVILGLISGYVSLGLFAFFLCLTIEIVYPNSFSGISGIDSSTDVAEQLMYYAYITLMTIGYGDILPLTSIAQKASILIGLLGQFYLVILTAIVVGKYINQQKS